MSFGPAQLEHWILHQYLLHYTRGNGGLTFTVFTAVSVCVSYRDRTEKQRMYSVSHGLNSGYVDFLALTRSADLAFRRSAL